MQPPDPGAVQFQQRFQAGILPFAIVQQWNVPCGYERSIKIVPGAALPNRYLLSIDTKLLNRPVVLEACLQLNMPEIYQRQVAHRFQKSSQFIMGFEEGFDSAVLKVYMETTNRSRPAVLNHVGWKWSVGTPTPQNPMRVTLYRRISCLDQLELITWLCKFARPSANGPRWLDRLVEQIGNDISHLICLEVLEAGQSRGIDLNLYSLDKTVDWLWPVIADALQVYSIAPLEAERIRSLCAARRLGHLSVGREHFTLYYS